MAAGWHAAGIRVESILAADWTIVTFEILATVVGAKNAFGPAYTTVPNRRPMPAVIPMANAPQKVMRIMLGVTSAPPARAYQRTQKRGKISEVPDTMIIRLSPQQMTVADICIPSGVRLAR